VAAQAQAVKPAAQNATSNYQTSLTAAKYIASATMHNICYLRDLFPDDTFTNHNIAGLEVKMIDVEHAGVPTEALLIHNLVKEGAFHALKKGCLSKLIFGIAEDMDANIIMEEYMLCFSYNEHGIKVNLDNSSNHSPSKKTSKKASVTSNNKKPLTITTESIKSEMVKIIRSLVATTATLEPVPTERFLFMKLEYIEGTDDSYEPPHFEAAGPRAFGSFRRKPFVLGLGEMKAFNHQMVLGMKTVLDGCGHDADQVGSGGPVMENSRMEENSDSDDDDGIGEEEGEEEKEMVVEAKGKRGAISPTSSDNADDEPPPINNYQPYPYHRYRHHLEVTAMDLFSEPQYDGDEMLDAENNNNNTDPSSHLNSNPNDNSQEGPPSVGGRGGAAAYTDKEMDAVRSWVLSLQQVHILDALSRFPMISTEAVQLILDVLQDEELLAPGEAQDCYKVLQKNQEQQVKKMKIKGRSSTKNKAKTDASLAADLKRKLVVQHSNAPPPPSNGMQSDDADIVSGPGSILTQSAVHGIGAPILDMMDKEEDGGGNGGGKAHFWPSSQQPESVAGAVKTVKRSFNIETIHQGKKARMSATAATATPAAGGGGDGEMKKGMVGPATSMIKGKNGERSPATAGTGMRVSTRPKRTPASRGGGRK
jgi:hypothetical protein